MQPSDPERRPRAPERQSRQCSSQGNNYVTTNDDSEMEGKGGLQLNMIGGTKVDPINTPSPKS